MSLFWTSSIVSWTLNYFQKHVSTFLRLQVQKEASDDYRIMNWKGYGRKQLWSNLRYYTSICQEGLNKTTEILSQNGRTLNRNLNPGLPECEAAVPTTSASQQILLTKITESLIRTVACQNITFYTGMLLWKQDCVSDLRTWVFRHPKTQVL
jgi:hypothetical protein